MFLLEPVPLTTLGIKLFLLQTEEIGSEYLRDNKCESTQFFFTHFSGPGPS